MSRYKGPERRRYYRLKYPTGPSLCPIAAIGGRPYLVTEISECGLRFRNEERRCQPDEELGQIWIRFNDGELVEVESAFVVRVHGYETAVEFDHCVTFDRMVKEQMEVIRNSFPDNDPDETEAEAAAIVSMPKQPARPRSNHKVIRFAQLRRLHKE